MKLLDYIRGLRKGKEAHRLEKESMKDSFLADAMDGYTQQKGDHEKQIEQLHKRVTARSASSKRTHAVSWSVAACLLIGVGLSSYFLFLKNLLPEENLMAIEQVTSKEDSLIQKETVVQPAAQEPKQSVAVVSSPSTHNQKEMAKVQVTVAPQSVELEEMSAVADEARASAPSHTINGKVVDEKGEPIIGANVLFKGTQTGTVTDIDGKFSLKKNEDTAELTAQYIGYELVSIPVDTGRNVLIAMREDKQALNEVVVVGYGTQKKSTLTGSRKVTLPKTKDKIRTPQPVIGQKAYKEYLEKNIRPLEGECKDIKGAVILNVFIDLEGNPQHIAIVQGLCEAADKEAIRLVREGPKWSIGTLPAKVEVSF